MGYQMGNTGNNAVEWVTDYKTLQPTAATALLLNGMSIAYISKLLGHSDIRTTQIYLKVETIELKNELAQKHPRLTFEKQLQNKKEVEKNEV